METNFLHRCLAGFIYAALSFTGFVHAANSELTAMRIKGEGPILDQEARFWQQAKAVKVAMLPQLVATPHHPAPAISELKVKAAHNGQWLAVLIEWPDATKNDRIVADQFGDQVAIQFPVDSKGETPLPMMGNPKGRVNILQWRAAFQRDIEQGPPQVTDLYPYTLVDLYPDQVLRTTDARPYSGALGMDNPVSRAKESPVLDQMAEGFSTMTVKPDQHADGKGVWKNGIWRVVITMPLATESANAPRFTPGNSSFAAFAVWDGEKREVGGRKSWSGWIPLKLAK